MGTAVIPDPVCGMPVDPASAWRASHGGREYLFCSVLCRDKFQQAMRPSSTRTGWCSST